MAFISIGFNLARLFLAGSILLRKGCGGENDTENEKEEFCIVLHLRMISGKGGIKIKVKKIVGGFLLQLSFNHFFI